MICLRIPFTGRLRQRHPEMVSATGAESVGGTQNTRDGRKTGMGAQVLTT
jgi:hypothetical protein